MKGNSETPTEPDEGETITGESRSVYETVFDEMSDAAFLIDVEQSDQDYTFTYLRNNDSHQRRTGLSETELRGQTPRDILDDEQGTVVAENYRRCVEQEETIRYEERLDLPGGTSHWQTKLTPIVDAGEVTQIVGVARDITEQKEQEQQLKRIHRRFKTVMETMSAAVFLKDADGQYLVMNQACRELFNVEDEDVVGLTDNELFPSDIAGQAKTDDQQVIENEEAIKIEETIPTTTGDTVRLTRKSPVYGEDGEVIALCGVSTDITDRKEREQEFQIIRERFERLANNVEDAFFMLPADYSETEYVNPAVETIYGITPEEAHDNPMFWLRHVYPDDKDELLADIEAQQDGIVEWPVEQEFRIEHPERGMRWVRARLDQVTDGNGDTTGFTGVSTDITSRKQAEQKLKESKEQLTEQNTALESLAEIVTDTEKTFNQKVSDLLNLGAAYLDIDIGILSKIDGSEYTVQNVITPNEEISPGDTFDLSDTYCSLVYDADGPVSFHSANDGGIENHPAYAKQGLESYIGAPVFVDDKRYGTLNFSQPEARERAITDAEESFVRIMAQWVGTKLTRQQRQEKFERISKFLQDTQEVAEVGGWEMNLETEKLRWSEKIYRIHGLPLDANPTPEDAIDFYHPDDRDTIREVFDRVTADGEPYDLELRIVTTDDEVRWVRTRGEPRYEEGEMVAVCGAIQDITERKGYEQEIEEQRDNLKLLNQVVRHDIRNNLQVIRGHASMIEECTDKSGQEHIDTVQKCTKSAIELTKTARNLSETMVNTETDIEPVRLDQHLDSVINNARSEFDDAIITVETPIPNSIVSGNNLLKAVFRNLLKNAVVHNDKETPQIQLSVTVNDETLTVAVADNGPGISDDHKEEIFGKGNKGLDSPGTGIGLYLVQTLVDQYGGDVRVEDNNPEGAVFVVELPMIDAEQA
ncbi:PAS domain-containing sensor histidine kinase [Halonotius pteroides]|uniref:histidine kinase n=2 Tax=Halonotius pteroides TaxID=268735 RepID=A0A3A6Q286_9EURY|nr:PAS domain-containing sensor histidine kinase [Halonotius pteroides]